MVHLHYHLFGPFKWQLSRKLSHADNVVADMQGLFQSFDAHYLRKVYIYSCTNDTSASCWISKSFYIFSDIRLIPIKCPTLKGLLVSIIIWELYKIYEAEMPSHLIIMFKREYKLFISMFLWWMIKISLLYRRNEFFPMMYWNGPDSKNSMNKDAIQSPRVLSIGGPNCYL